MALTTLIYGTEDWTLTKNSLYVCPYNRYTFFSKYTLREWEKILIIHEEKENIH